MEGYKHYIRINEQAVVIHGFSDAFEQPVEGDVELPGEHGRHFQIPLLTDRGQYRYKIVGGQLVERSEEELDAEWAARPPAPPSTEERLEATEQAIIAMMEAITGV